MLDVGLGAVVGVGQISKCSVQGRMALSVRVRYLQMTGKDSTASIISS